MPKYRVEDVDAAAMEESLARIKQQLTQQGLDPAGVDAARSKLESWLSEFPQTHAERYCGMPDVYVLAFPATADNHANFLAVIFQVFEQERSVVRMQYRLMS